MGFCIISKLGFTIVGECEEVLRDLDLCFKVRFEQK